MANVRSPKTYESSLKKLQVLVCDSTFLWFTPFLISIMNLLGDAGGYGKESNLSCGNSEGKAL